VAAEFRSFDAKKDLNMVVSLDLEAKILRFYHVEKWRITTIARQLGVHHETVARVLAQAGLPRNGAPARPRMVDPYLPLIRQTLETFPTLTSNRLFAMVRERGYSGGPDHFRHVIATLRPRPRAEAYLRLRTLIADEAQIDWAHFGVLNIGRARRPLMAFVAVLSYSRAIFLRFFLNAQMENFLRGHDAAFRSWNGVPRVCKYDNLRSAVLERNGDVIRFNPILLEFAGHYRFEPRPVAIARGNEKGRVERAIRFARSSFFAARDFVDLEDLNRQAAAWCDGMAADRRCPGDEARTVREVFTEEQPRLLKIPDVPFPLHERKVVAIGKTPYARFDLNDYSVPHTSVRRQLVVLADLHQVRVVDGDQVLACHPRSYDKGAQVEDPSHIEDLAQQKRAARRERATDRLAAAVPASETLLRRAAERGDNLGTITATLMRLLAGYGAAELQAAIVEALERDRPHPNTVLLILERRREQRNQPPPINIPLPEHVQAKDAPVQPHRLDTYDQLKQLSDDDAQGDDQ
jgi:transposase